MALNDVASKLAAFYQKLEDRKLNEERFYIKARLEVKLNEIEKAIIPLEKQEEQSEKEKQCLKEIKLGVDRLRSLGHKLEENFSIFVIGDGNVGKSTVVNSLLGQEAAKIKFDPMTWKVDVFYAQKQPSKMFDRENAKVQLVSYEPRENKVEVVSYQEAKERIDEEERKKDESIDKIQACIKEKTEVLNKVCKAQRIPYREVAGKLEAYKAKLWEEELYVSSIIEAKWPVKTNELLDNFQIVDTPGLRQNRGADILKESIQKYYEEADGIIWVLDINKIAMNSTREYINEIEETLLTKGKACDQKRMLVLLNRSDCIRTEAEKKIILEQARSMYLEEFNEILPFSASLALKGRLEGDASLLEVSGFNTLEAYIQSHLLKGAIENKTQKVLSEIQREEIKFEVMLSYYAKEITQGLEDFEVSNEEITQKFDEIEAQSLKQLENMVLSYRHTVEAAIEKETESLLDVKGDKENWLRERILRISKVENEVKELLEHITNQVELIKGEYLNKEGLRRISEEPIRDFIDGIQISTYFKALQEELALDKQEDSPLRRLISGMSKIKKLVDRPLIDTYKEKLYEGIEEITERFHEEIVQGLKSVLQKEKLQLLEIRKKQVDENYGKDELRMSSMNVLREVEHILQASSRESHVKDYIKGIGEGEWNNILTN